MKIRIQINLSSNILKNNNTNIRLSYLFQQKYKNNEYINIRKILFIEKISKKQNKHNNNNNNISIFCVVQHKQIQIKKTKTMYIKKKCTN